MQFFSFVNKYIIGTIKQVQLDRGAVQEEANVQKQLSDYSQFYLENIDQGHIVRLLQRFHSMAHIRMYKNNI